MPGDETIDDLARQFDARAEQYDESAFHRALADEVASFAGAAGVSSVLDVATGTGLVLRSLPREASRRLVGVDISAGMLGVAAAHLPGAHLLKVDASAALPFDDGSFDLITCVTALHLMSSPTDALRGWRRLLSPGGRVVVAVFRTDTADDVPEVLEAIRDGARRRPHGTHSSMHERTGTPAVLAAIADDAGYTMTRSQTWVHREPLEMCLIAELAPAT